MVAVVLLALTALTVLPWLVGDRQAHAARRHRRHRRHRRGRSVARPELGEVDVEVLLDLADAALAAGAAVPGTLQALGRAVAGPSTAAAGAPTAPVGAALLQAGRALLLGAPWQEAWQGAPPHLTPLADALEPAWVDGAAPGPLLRQAAGSIRATRHRQAQEAAARLGVRLVLPLGLCFLPAFVLLGLVPVVISAGGGILGG